MRQPKQSDSPSGYDREIRPRKAPDDLAEKRRELERLEQYERDVHARVNERWLRKTRAVLQSEPRPLVPDFGTWVSL